MRSVTVVIGCMAVFAFLAAAGSVAFAAASGDTFSARVGEFQVDMLSEAQREGRPDILIDPSPKDVDNYIPSGTFPNAVCVFLVRAPGRTVLIDTGYGTKLFDNMASLGVKAGDVDAVLITHAHGDHIGGLLKDGVPAFPKARVYAAKREFDWSSSLRDKLGPYKDRAVPFAPGQLESGEELLPGIRAIWLPGHTPGHTVFMIESGDERMLIWGDLAHAMAIQMPRPGVSVTYDDDPAQAAESRKAVLKYISGDKTKMLVGGMHVPFPGIGRVSADPNTPGGYTFTPEGE